MFQFTLIILLSLLYSCSKGSAGSKSSPPSITYNAVYEYPSEPSLNPGDGVVELEAVGVLQCFDSKNNEVDVSLCPPIHQAPAKLVASPAGEVTISVNGATGGFVTIEVVEGEHYPSLSQTEINNRIDLSLVCEVTHVKVAHECKIPGFELILSSYTSPTLLSVCSGTETLTRNVIGCRDTITMLNANSSNCTGKTDPAPAISHQSPAGSRDSLSGSNTVHQSCALGSTTWVQTDITCGNSEEHKEGTGMSAICVPDVFTASDFTYPTNTMSPGDGELTVDANGFDTCTNVSKSIPALVSKCDMPLPVPNMDQESPAGSKDLVSGTTVIHQYCEAGETICEQTDITCNDEDQHKSGTGSSAVCENDVFTPSDFEYPANSLAACGGEQTVDATSFLTCTNTSKSESADLSKCQLPNPTPSVTHTSPAGSVVNDIDDGSEEVTCLEGESTGTTVITCDSGFTEINGACISGPKQIVSGWAHSCSLYNDKTVKCSGQNTLGQFGNGTVTNSNTPVLVSEFEGAIQLAAGANWTCALMDDSSVKCSGSNSNGAMGFGHNSQVNTATNVADFNGAKKIVAGENATCALMLDNNVKCSGFNIGGQLADGSFTNKLSPSTAIGLTGVVKDIASSGTNTCVIMANDSVKCSGQNQFIFGGSNAATNTSSFTDVPGFTNVKSIAVSYQLVCALFIDTTVKCIGHGFYTGMANGVTTNSNSAVTITAFNNAKQIKASQFNFCAILQDDSVRCSGKNDSGGLVTGNTARQVNSVQVHSSAKDIFLSIVDIVYVVEPDGTTLGSGYNVNGQLGAGSNTNSTSLIVTGF